MDKAKAAINDFMHKSGHHDTTVHETVAPAVQHEVVKPHRHEEVVTAIDKEVHQDHYHRTVQPIKDREVLPEKHSHNLGAVQHREVDHRDHDATKRALEVEKGAFKNETVTQATTQSQSAAPTVAGEHIHHHIHETIQPVVKKETIQPHVVHTTVPIHETHHNAAQHHETSQLPVVSMAEFKERGGILGGREERYDGFEGAPKNIGGAVAEGLKGHHHREDSHHTSHTREAGALGHKTGDVSRTHAAHGDIHSDREHGSTMTHDNSLGHKNGGLGHNTGNLNRTEGGLGHNNGGLGHNTSDLNRTEGGFGHKNGGLGHNTSDLNRTEGGLGHKTGDLNRTGDRHTDTTQTKKPSLLDRLNPMVDSDRDGKKGVFE